MPSHQKISIDPIARCPPYSSNHCLYRCWFGKAEVIGHEPFWLGTEMSPVNLRHLLCLLSVFPCHFPHRKDHCQFVTPLVAQAQNPSDRTWNPPRCPPRPSLDGFRSPKSNLACDRVNNNGFCLYLFRHRSEGYPYHPLMLEIHLDHPFIRSFEMRQIDTTRFSDFGAFNRCTTTFSMSYVDCNQVTWVRLLCRSQLIWVWQLKHSSARNFPYICSENTSITSPNF